MQVNNDFSSPNHAPRIKAIEYIILHYTQMPFADALFKLTDAASEVSCHYFIREDGQIFQLVPDNMIAWHAGESAWMDSVKLNQNSIGIELDNLGDGSFSNEQMQACIGLCHYLTNKHNIDPVNIIGHSDIAPKRKIDPGIFFDWQLLAANGLGIKGADRKYDHNEASRVLFTFGEKHEDIKVLQQNLRQLGYNLEISGKLDISTNNVIRAFQAHFVPEIIQAKGLEFYQDMSSKYEWDVFSDEALRVMTVIARNA